MRKTRLLSLALAVLMTVVLFAGCQSSSPSSNPTDDGPGTDPVTLRWALWDLDKTVYYQPLVDAYRVNNPNVTIELVDLGSTDFMTVLSTQLSGNADFDILTIKDIPGYANLVKQGHLEPLGDYISSANIDTSLYGGTVEQISVDSKVYALPFRSDFWVVFYNKDLFDAAGVDYPTNDMTLDQYSALAAQVTTGTGNDKVYGNHYHTWRSAVQLFSILDGQNTIVDGSYDFLKPYYERVLNDQNTGVCQDYATLKTSSIHYSDAFFNNQIAMMNMGSWFIATQIAKVEAGEAESVNWGMVKYPHPDGVEAGTTLGTITALGVNAKSSKKAAALDFMKFVTGPDGAAAIAATGTIPAIKNDAVIASITGIKGFPTDENSKDALKTFKTYLEMPMHDKSADIEVILNEEHDSIMTGNKSIDDAIAAMNTRVGELLK